MEIVTGCLCILIAASLVLYIRTTSWYTPGVEIMDNTSFFPLGACIILGLLGVRQCLWAMRLPLSQEFVRINYKGILLIALWLVYAFLLPTLGFLAGSVIFLILSMLLWGEKRWRYMIPVAVCLPLSIYIVLGKILHVGYPAGIIPF